MGSKSSKASKSGKASKGKDEYGKSVARSIRGGKLTPAMEGEAAFAQGRVPAANPHPVGSGQFNEWQQGYDRAANANAGQAAAKRGKPNQTNAKGKSSSKKSGGKKTKR